MFAFLGGIMVFHIRILIAVSAPIMTSLVGSIRHGFIHWDSKSDSLVPLTVKIFGTPYSECNSPGSAVGTLCNRVSPIADTWLQ